MTKLYCSGTLGLLLGYLSGYILYFSSSIIRVTLVILLISLLFLRKAKKDIWLRYVLHVTLMGTIFFIYGNIVGHNLRIEDKTKSENINSSAKVSEITVKDNSKILEVIFFGKDKPVYFDSASIYIYGQNNFYVGEDVFVSGKISNSFIILPKDKETDFKSFDLGKYWKTKNIDGVMFNAKVSSTTEERSSESFLSLIKSFGYQFRKNFSSKLNLAMPNEEAGIVMAMLFGDESNISVDTNETYKRAGLSHVLVLSGFNLAILVAAALFVLKDFSLKKKMFGSAILILIFLILAKTGISIFRAALMSGYFIVGSLFMRDINLKFLIWFIAFILCLFLPYVAIFSVSFHLSMIATISIIFLYPKIQENLFFIKNKLIKESFSVTLAASLGVAPYLAYQFGYFNLFSIFVSAIVSLFIPLIMFFGFFAGAVTYVSPLLGKIFGYIAFVFTNIMSSLASLSSNMGSLVSQPIDFYTLCIIYMSLFIVYYLSNFSLFYKK